MYQNFFFFFNLSTYIHFFLLKGLGCFFLFFSIKYLYRNFHNYKDNDKNQFLYLLVFLLEYLYSFFLFNKKGHAAIFYIFFLYRKTLVLFELYFHPKFFFFLV
jgi:hypothetical protein